MKRKLIISLQKCMVLFLLPALLLPIFSVSAGAVGQSSARSVFFCTDIHGRTDYLDTVLDAVEDDTDLSLAVFGGDCEASTASIDGVVADYFPSADTVFVTGNHDDAEPPFVQSGEVFNNEYYAVYAIAYDDFGTAATALSDYLYAYCYNEENALKPLFVISHLPLHEDRGDNVGAYNISYVLNYYAQYIDIVFLHGHNHTVDRTLYFYSPGKFLDVEGAPESQALNYTYMTAGYCKHGYGVSVTVNDMDISFQRYDTDGRLGDAYIVQRIRVPNPDAVRDIYGHICGAGEFSPDAKAMKYVCPKCGDIHFERMQGDVDGDGTVSAGDARLALRRSVELEVLDASAIIAADADGDKTVTAADARYILRRSVNFHDAEMHWKPFPVDKNGKPA